MAAIAAHLLVQRIAKQIPGWKRVLKTADVQEEKIAKHVSRAFAKGHKSLPKKVTSHKQAEEALNRAVLVTEKALKAGMDDLLFETLALGGDAAATNLVRQAPVMRASSRQLRTLAKKPPIGYEFDRTNEKSVEWAKERAGDLIDGISDTTREKIREIIGDVVNEGDWDEAYDELQDIFDDEDRTRMIARTESMTATNEGQRDLWEQAVKDGYLNGDEQQVWITTPDDKLCDICEPLEGVTVGMDEDFPEEGPPAHPNCRCTIGLLAAGAAGEEEEQDSEEAD